jgi:hypothetical protein
MMPYYPPASAAGGGYNLIQEEGVAVTARTTIDFVGGSVTATDTGSKTQVAVSAGAVSISSANIAFTDGDTMRRATITDASVTAGSKIVGTIRRPDQATDSVDRGYIYNWSVVEVYAGGFDILISALGWGFDDTTRKPPNETVVFYYVLG